jgi:hypothetical protein
MMERQPSVSVFLRYLQSVQLSRSNIEYHVKQELVLDRRSGSSIIYSHLYRSNLQSSYLDVMQFSPPRV